MSEEVGPLTEVTTKTSTSSVPVAAAAWKRRVGLILAKVLVATTIALTGLAIFLVYRTATSGSPDAQRLAFALIGTTLGILWSQFAKLYETVTKD